MKNNDILVKYNLAFEDRLLLTETGLLQPESNISRGLKQNTSDNLIYFQSGRFIIKTIKKANTPENRIEIFRFTKIGEELLKLINPNPLNDYIKYFCLRLVEFCLDVDYDIVLCNNSYITISHYIHLL